MGKLSRTKGAAFERRVARWLTKVLGRQVWRQTDETQQGNVGDHRVSLSPSVNLVGQAKHQKSPSVWRALDEAEEAASPSDLAVAFVRRHGGEDVVVMRPDTFSLLLRALAKGRAMRMPDLFKATSRIRW